MKIVVIGGNGRLLACLGAISAFSRSAGQIGLVVPGVSASKRPLVEVIAIDEFARIATEPVEESPHPGERHRQAVNRVNSKRSRAGKAARWS